MRRRNRRRPINRVAQFLAWLRDFAHRNRERGIFPLFSSFFLRCEGKNKRRVEGEVWWDREGKCEGVLEVSGCFGLRYVNCRERNIRIFLFFVFCFLRDLNR